VFLSHFTSRLILHPPTAAPTLAAPAQNVVAGSRQLKFDVSKPVAQRALEASGYAPALATALLNTMQSSLADIDQNTGGEPRVTAPSESNAAHDQGSNSKRYRRSVIVKMRIVHQRFCHPYDARQLNKIYSCLASKHCKSNFSVEAPSLSTRRSTTSPLVQPPLLPAPFALW